MWLIHNLFNRLKTSLHVQLYISETAYKNLEYFLCSLYEWHEHNNVDSLRCNLFKEKFRPSSGSGKVCQFQIYWFKKIMRHQLWNCEYCLHYICNCYSCSRCIWHLLLSTLSIVAFDYTLAGATMNAAFSEFQGIDA